MTLLTDAEREKIRESEVLRRDIQRALGDEQSKCGFSAFFKHPAILLILGFGFTTVLGTWLTSRWNQREWENQQRHLEQQRTLDMRYTVIERTFKEVAETNTAAEDILAGYTWEKWTPKEIKEEKDYWRTTSRNWRVASKILQQDLTIYFSDPQISSTFENILNKRRQLGNSITNPLQGGTSKKEIDAEKSADQTLINDTENLLKTCGALMVTETREPN